MIVTLFSRRDCHLCQETEQLLVSLARGYGFSLQVRDIDADIELQRRYGWLVPVVRFEDGFELSAPIEAAGLRAAVQERVQP